MLIGLGVACAWIAMSAASALGLVLAGRLGAAGGAGGARAGEQVDIAHEEIYPLEPLPAVDRGWR